MSMTVQQACRDLGIVLLLAAAALGGPARAQKETAPPDAQTVRIRGEITRADASSITVKTPKGLSVTLRVPEQVAVFSLSRAGFSDVYFGTYVGAVSRKLGENVYSPIVRDSLSWLHQGFELRIIDESLRGIAVGHTRWDLTPDSVITHGWVDDLEQRVMSIKYGPTEEEETDVEVARDVPILRMTVGERSLVRVGAGVTAGAQVGPDGSHTAVFIFVGADGVVPPL
jgi:hypothetical protein